MLNLERMREQDVDRQNFRPYEKPGYVPLDEVISSSDSHSQFRSAIENKLYLNAMSRIANSLEELLGKKVYVVDGDLIPKPWQKIELYLQERGLAERFVLLPPFNDYPKLFHAYLRMTPAVQELTDGIFHGENMSSNATSTDIDTALSKTAGEFLERYSLALHRKKDLLRMNYGAALKAGCISLDTYCANKRVEISGEQEFLWVRGGRIIGGTGSVLLPAQLVYWNYDNTHGSWREPVLSESNTNGAGAGPSLEAAILAGVYELIERDGFLIYWLNSISPSVIEPDAISMPELGGLIDDCKRYGLKVYFLNTMSDISIPTCTAVVVDDSGIGPKVAIGAGSASAWEIAMMSALGEALSVAYGLRRRFLQGEDYGYLRENDPTLNINKRLRLSIWGNTRMFKHFEFFLTGPKVNLSDLRHFEHNCGTKTEELEAIVKAVKDADNSYDIYYYSVKSKVLRELGFNSVKVIIPQLVPLYLREIFLPAGAERLRNVPPKLGRTASPVLNKFAHPFP